MRGSVPVGNGGHYGRREFLAVRSIDAVEIVAGAVVGGTADFDLLGDPPEEFDGIDLRRRPTRPTTKVVSCQEDWTPVPTALASSRGSTAHAARSISFRREPARSHLLVGDRRPPKLSEFPFAFSRRGRGPIGRLSVPGGLLVAEAVVC